MDEQKQKTMKLDLGCGARKKSPEYTGVDISSDCGADIVHDLSKTPWPFENESVDEIYSSHFFEHLDGKQRIAFMEECYRILKPGAEATIVTPYWTSVRAIADPTHQWPPISEVSYLYFSKKWREENDLRHYGINCDFVCREYVLKTEKDTVTMGDSERKFALKHYINAIEDLSAILVKK